MSISAMMRKAFLIMHHVLFHCKAADLQKDTALDISAELAAKYCSCGFRSGIIPRLRPSPTLPLDSPSSRELFFSAKSILATVPSESSWSCFLASRSLMTPRDLPNALIPFKPASMIGILAAEGCVLISDDLGSLLECPVEAADPGSEPSVVEGPLERSDGLSGVLPPPSVLIDGLLTDIGISGESRIRLDSLCKYASSSSAEGEVRLCS